MVRCCLKDGVNSISRCEIEIKIKTCLALRASRFYFLRGQLNVGYAARQSKKEGAGLPSFGLRLLNDKNGNTNAGMQHVKQEVLAVDVINVAVIVV